MMQASLSCYLFIYLFYLNSGVIKGSGVIKQVSLPFLLDSSKTSNKLIGGLNFYILKISYKHRCK